MDVSSRWFGVLGPGTERLGQMIGCERLLKLEVALVQVQGLVPELLALVGALV